jgi:hypothetical protein
MNQPRSFYGPVTGEQLFGDRLPDSDLCDAEIYSADQATIFEIMRWSRRLIDGGPPVDRQLLTQLHADMDNSPQAKEQLQELMKYVNWFRVTYALRMLEDRKPAADLQ